MARSAPHAGIDNLNTRIRSWWVMAALIGIALWLGTLAVFALFGVIALLALREYIVAPVASRARPWIMGLALAVCLLHIPALLTMDIAGYGERKVFLLVYLVLIAQASDVLQYVWGKLLGKHRIASPVSPSKTMEGSIGGVICATALGASLWWITPFTLPQAAMKSLTITVLGFVSLLILSAQKRARGIKDWGNLIKGHGGVLDRMDSLWLSAPLFYYLMRYGWAGG